MADTGKDTPIRIFPALPTTERGRSFVMGEDPQGKNFLYTHLNSVYIRDIENPTNVDIYCEHGKKVLCAKYSPSRFYIASADVTGKVKIWDTVNAEHVMKCEYQPISGPIKDIAWDPESKRIAVCGEGRQKFAHAFLVDTGSSVGDLSGMSKACNSISYKPSRPYRIVCGTEAKNAVFFEGPPFKFSKTLTDHANFVNTVRYSSDGNLLITGGSDGQVFIYDGKTADLIGKFGENEKAGKAHAGGVYSICFSPDNSKILTASGDKTAKIWNVASRELESTFQAGETINDMFLSCLWQGNYILLVSLNGYIYYLNEKDPTTCVRVIKGHNACVTSLAFNEDKSSMYTGDLSGRVVCWNSVSGDNEVLDIGTDKQIQGLAIVGDILISVDLGDTLRFSTLGQSQHSFENMKLDSQPKALAAKSDLVAIACENHVVLWKKERLSSQAVKYEPVSVDISPDCNLIAFGGQKDNKVHLFNVSGGELSSANEIDNTGPVMDVKFSPDGQFIATAGGDRYVRCYKVGTGNFERVLNYPGHTAKVNCVAWSPDGSRFATGSLDTNIAIWDLTKSSPIKTIKGAHPFNHIVRLIWLNDQILVSAGHDSNVKQWEIK